MFEEKYNETNGDLLKAFDEVMDMLEDCYPDAYKKAEESLYIAINGYHFNEDMLEKALHCMDNDDNSYAPKWTLEQTDSVASSTGFKFDHYNHYDYCYVMNMLYSDYCKVLGDNYNSYAKMAEKFLNDKDAPKGKALRYYLAMGNQ